jgi:hypothetical protein
MLKHTWIVEVARKGQKDWTEMARVTGFHKRMVFRAAEDMAKQFSDLFYEKSLVYEMEDERGVVYKEIS